MKFAALVGFALFATVASGDMVMIGAQKDAMIFGSSAGADTNFASGMGPAMFAGADGSLNRKRSLVQFDIAGKVPAGATITGVTLSLYLGQVAGSGGGGNGSAIPSRNLALFDLNQDWTEGTSGQGTAGVGGSGQGFTRTTGDTSWDYASYNSANTLTGTWNDGTNNLHGGNFSATASATSTFAAPYALNSAFTWSSPGMVADVQQWLDNSASNHGWLLRALTGVDSTGKTVDLEGTSQSFLGFWTKDGAAINNTPGVAPALTITYTTVPEPTILGGIAAGLLIRRRRRAV